MRSAPQDYLRKADRVELAHICQYVDGLKMDEPT